MNKEKIEKTALVTLLVLGLLYAYYTYLFSPEWEVLQTVKGQLMERQQHYNQLASLQENMSALGKDIEAVSNEDKDLSAQIPPRLENPQIMVDIYNSAKLYGVAPNTLQFEPLQNKGSYQAVGMTFTCKGKVGDVLSMIIAFGNTSLQKLSVQSVAITAEKASTTANSSQPAGISDSPAITPTAYAPVPALSSQPHKLTLMSTNKIIADASLGNSIDPHSGDQISGENASIEDLINQLTQEGKSDTLSPDPATAQAVVTAKIKLTAYASSLGTANVNNPNPPFMSAQFGVNSAAEMFK
ncbi:MAG: hypothetical protein Q8912_14040 [Bacillota bacterium]|nr:hypothetical protein [Bacillota bacterium]